MVHSEKWQQLPSGDDIYRNHVMSRHEFYIPWQEEALLVALKYVDVVREKQLWTSWRRVPSTIMGASMVVRVSMKFGLNTQESHCSGAVRLRFVLAWLGDGRKFRLHRGLTTCGLQHGHRFPEIVMSVQSKGNRITQITNCTSVETDLRRPSWQWYLWRHNSKCRKIGCKIGTCSALYVEKSHNLLGSKRQCSVSVERQATLCHATGKKSFELFRGRLERQGKTHTWRSRVRPGSSFVTTSSFGTRSFGFQAVKIPAPKAAVDEECAKFKNLTGWDESKVKSKKR